MIINTNYQGVTFSAEVTPAAEIRDWWRHGPKSDEYQVEFLSVVTDGDGWEYVGRTCIFDYDQFFADTEISFSDLHDAAIAARLEYEFEPPTVDAFLLLS